jgi:hypothetical protein
VSLSNLVCANKIWGNKINKIKTRFFILAQSCANKKTAGNK